MSDPFAQTHTSTDAPTLPAAPSRNVTHLGRPSDLGASVLGHLIDTAARGYPGEWWTARWTPGEVRLTAPGSPVRILLATRGTSADVRIRATLGGPSVPEAHFALARALRDALALHERVNAESVAGALAAGVEPARLLPAAPAPAPVAVSHADRDAPRSGPRCDAITRAIQSAAASGPWSVEWYNRLLGRAWGPVGSFRVSFGGGAHEAVIDDLCPPGPELDRVARAVRSALVAQAQEAA